MVKQNWHCSNCGSTNVNVGATATWSVGQQRWVLDAVDDEITSDFCFECGDFCPGEFRDVSDLKTAASLAIQQNETSNEEK